MPGILDRIRTAWKAFQYGAPRPLNIKSSPMAWPSWRAGVPQWQIFDFQGYVNEGFNLNGLIYSAIMFKVRSISQAPLRAYTGDIDNPVPCKASHPLAQLVARPNKYQSWMALQNANTCYLNIAGNVFMALDRPNRKALPSAIYSLRPDRVFIVPDGKGGLQGYYYVPEGKSVNDGVAILPENMIHVKLPNPGDPLEGLGYGLSPISSLAHSADVDNGITKFIKLFFERGAIVPILLKFKYPMSPDQIAKVKERWHEQYGSYENWSEVGVLDSEADIERAGLTFDEMGFDGLDERNESRILGPFGVPPILIGTRMGLQRSTYSNYGEARRACWEDTLIPELMWYENAMQPYLQDGNAFVAFDTSKVPALQKDIPVLVGAAYQLWQMGTSADVSFQTVGIPIEKVPGVTDKHFIPIGMVEVGAPRPAPQLPPMPEAQPASEETPEEAPQEEAPENEQPAPDVTDEEQQVKGASKKKAFSPNHKLNLWTKTDRIATSWEGKFGEAVGRQLEKDKREMLALLTQAKEKSLELKSTVKWESFEEDAATYLDRNGATNWRSTFVPLLQGVITDQAESLNVNMGMRFDVRNLWGEKWWRDYQLKFAQDINFTTKADIHKLVAQAMQNGWSIPEMQKQLEATFDRYTNPDFTLDGRKLTDEEAQWFNDRRPAYRRENIARTETLRASNAGSNALYKDWGAQQKEWYATADDRTREDHRIGTAWGKSPLVVGIDEKFEVGGELLEYPGDPSGSPGNVCQCRCTVLPVIGEQQPPEEETPETEPQEEAPPVRQIPETEAAYSQEVQDVQQAYQEAMQTGNIDEANGIKPYLNEIEKLYQNERDINDALWKQRGIVPSEATPQDWQAVADNLRSEGYDLYKKYTKEGIEESVAQKRGAKDAGYADVGGKVVQVRKGRFSVREGQRIQGDMWAGAKEELSQAYGKLLKDAGYAESDIAHASFEQRAKLLDELGKKEYTARKIDDVPPLRRQEVVKEIDYDMASTCDLAARDPLSTPTIDAYRKMQVADIIESTILGI